MNLLVTGGAGFIGSNFLHHLSQKYPDYKLVNLDKLTYAGNLENVKKIEKKANYFFIQGDIADAPLVKKIIQEHQIEKIVSFAAETHVDRSITEADPFIHTNVVGTQVLLDQALDHKLSLYLQISTDEVYGSRQTGYFSEEDPLEPSSPYSASKAAGDLLVQSYYKTYKLPVIITRCTNNYGPYQYPEKLIPFFIKKALKKESLPLYGDGKNVRDWIHVQDHVEALDEVLHKGKIGEIYNIAGANEHSNLEITKFILKELNLPEDLIEFVEDRPGHDFRYALDCKKIKLNLGWQPHINFWDGLKETIQWYQKYFRKHH